MRIKKILSWLIAACMLAAILPFNAFAAGEVALTAETTVESGGVYTISDMDGLNAFKTLIEAGNTFAGATVLLTNDIMIGTGWLAIGASREKSGSSYSEALMKVFSGTFDGQGYALKRPTFTIGNNRGYGIGFFGKVDGATIKNLNITDVSYSTNTSYGTFYGMGAIAGYANNSTIENCYVEGDASNLSVYTSTTIEHAGGLVGSATNTSFINCTNDCALELNFSAKRVGGIVGRLNGGRMYKCINKKNIASKGSDENYGGVGTGGLIGNIEAPNVTIDSCINEGNVTSMITRGSTTSYHSNPGGIVALIRTSSSGSISISNCWNKGEIRAGAYSAGGIVGRSGKTNSSAQANSAGNTCPVNIFNCLNTGYIGRYSGASNSTIDYSGGIAGATYQYNGVFAENCYNQGEMGTSSSVSSYNYSTTRSIIGYGYGSHAVAYVNHCYALKKSEEDKSGSGYFGPYTQDSSRAIGYDSKDKHMVFADLFNNAAADCADLNEYAATATSWTVSGESRLEAPVITREGTREYVDWIYDANGVINDGLPYLNLTDVGYQIPGPKYTVTVYSGDATSSYALELVTEDDGTVTATIPEATPSTESAPKEGMTFAGWYDSADGSGEDYAAGETLEITEDKDIYEVWGWQVTLDPANGEAESELVVVDAGRVVKPTAVPVKDGYGFAGWYDESAARTPNRYDFSAPVTEAINLTAKWMLWGDVTGDGKLNINDARQIQLYISEGKSLNQELAGYVYGVGEGKTINVAVCRLIQTALMTVGIEFPAEALTSGYEFNLTDNTYIAP